jgi:hypothetical protein
VPRRRNASDDEAWADRHEGECAVGHICELRETNPPGKPFEPRRGPLGFCVDPAAYRPVKRRRRGKVVAT